MRSLALSILILTGLLGCSPAPPATLELTNFAAHGNHIDIDFDSNINFLSLYEGNKYQTATSTAFICSFENDEEFKPESDMRKPARGSVDFIEDRSNNSKKAYRFRSHLVFHKTENSVPYARSPLSPQELNLLLASQQEMSCKVRILAYLSPRYLSNTLVLRTAPLSELTKKMANRPNASHE